MTSTTSNVQSIMPDKLSDFISPSKLSNDLEETAQTGFDQTPHLAGALDEDKSEPLPVQTITEEADLEPERVNGLIVESEPQPFAPDVTISYDEVISAIHIPVHFGSERMTEPSILASSNNPPRLEFTDATSQHSSTSDPHGSTEREAEVQQGSSGPATLEGADESLPNEVGTHADSTQAAMATLSPTPGEESDGFFSFRGDTGIARLFHHHSADAEPLEAFVSPPGDRERSSARRHTSSQPDPAVTRSKCHFVKLRLRHEDVSIIALVPQCTVGDREMLAREGADELGQATNDEERTALSQPLPLSDRSLLDDLDSKLHRIVSSSIIAEGHCFLLVAPDDAFVNDEDNKADTTPDVTIDQAEVPADTGLEPASASPIVRRSVRGLSQPRSPSSASPSRRITRAESRRFSEDREQTPNAPEQSVSSIAPETPVVLSGMPSRRLRERPSSVGAPRLSDYPGEASSSSSRLRLSAHHNAPYRPPPPIIGLGSDQEDEDNAPPTPDGGESPLLSLRPSHRSVYDEARYRLSTPMIHHDQDQQDDGKVATAPDADVSLVVTRSLRPRRSQILDEKASAPRLQASSHDDAPYRPPTDIIDLDADEGVDENDAVTVEVHQSPLTSTRKRKARASSAHVRSSRDDTEETQILLNGDDGPSPARRRRKLGPPVKLMSGKEDVEEAEKLGRSPSMRKTRSADIADAEPLTVEISPTAALRKTRSMARAEAPPLATGESPIDATLKGEPSITEGTTSKRRRWSFWPRK